MDQNKSNKSVLGLEKISIKTARVHAEISLTAAAEELGVSTSTLVNYERGRKIPRVDTALKMAELYKVPFETLDFVVKNKK